MTMASHFDGCPECKSPRGGHNAGCGRASHDAEILRLRAALRDLVGGMQTLKLEHHLPGPCERARAALSSPALHDDVIVPREPTEAMITNGARSIGSTMRRDNFCDRARACWAAMIGHEEQPQPRSSHGPQATVEIKSELLERLCAGDEEAQQDAKRIYGFAALLGALTRGSK